MKSRIVVLALVGLTAGALGATGSRILSDGAAETGSAPTEASAASQVTAGPRVADGCRSLAKKVRSSDLSDRELKRLLKRYPGCNTVVVDSPAGTSADPNVVTLPAPSQPAPATVAVSDDSGDGYDDDDEDSEDHEGYEGEDEAGESEDD
jgi:hypothetical protein